MFGLNITKELEAEQRNSGWENLLYKNRGKRISR